MTTIRYYKPGEIVTLYHHRKNKRFRGVLYINSPAPSLPLWPGLSKAFLVLAVISIVYTFFPPMYAEIKYQVEKVRKPPQVIPTLAEIPQSDEFFLEIPKINLTSTIIPNVDSANESVYLDKLKIGVAHAKGSYFPGDSGPIVLFSHSTDTLAHIVQYNAAFYALKDLAAGDLISVHFKGKIYSYKVADKKIINPADLETIRQSQSKLIMTTCWPPGTDWQRLIVFAS